jgi:hypothetical protein
LCRMAIGPDAVSASTISLCTSIGLAGVTT